MTRSRLFLISLFILCVAAAPSDDWKDVADSLGRAGSVQADGAYKVAFPRSDLHVTVEGIAIKPALALGSWAAFARSGSAAMVMGDLVLLETEVNAVIGELQKGGVEQSAVHNHLLGESPRVMYVHFRGRGQVAALARTLRRALETTKTPLSASAPPAASPLDLPAADLDRIIGRAGKANGGVYQFAIPRAEKIREDGMEIPPSMGVATAINLQPLGSGRAATTGDFVMRAGEVNAVIRALRAGGIGVTALHSHMLNEEPRLFFMHFWGVGDAKSLATTLRSALDAMNVRR